jgi:Methyltransferase domain
MRLNLGCGYDLRDGYVNVDFAPHHTPDVAGDVMHLPVRDAVAEEVFAQDVLEHLPRTSTADALREWARVVAPGGSIHARFPSLVHAVELMQRKNDVEGHRVLMQNLYGTQAYTGDVHLTSFTDLTVAEDFHAAGFRELVATVADEWMWDVWAKVTPGAPVGVFWGLGAYDLETDGVSSWRWLSDGFELSAVNSGDAPGSVRVRGEVRADHDPRRGRLRVSAPGVSQAVRNAQQLDVTVAVPPHSRTVVAFRADFAQVHAPQDHRVLRCQLIDPQVEVSEAGRPTG